MSASKKKNDNSDKYLKILMDHGVTEVFSWCDLRSAVDRERANLVCTSDPIAAVKVWAKSAAASVAACPGPPARSRRRTAPVARRHGPRTARARCGGRGAGGQGVG